MGKKKTIEQLRDTIGQLKITVELRNEEVVGLRMKLFAAESKVADLNRRYTLINERDAEIRKLNEQLYAAQAACSERDKLIEELQLRLDEAQGRAR